MFRVHLSVLNISNGGNAFWTTTFLCLCIFLSSCVSNKKITYLQDQDLKKSNIGSKEQIHSMTKFEYKIRPGDVLAVQINSLTNIDIDFLNSEQGQLRQTVSSQHPFLNGYEVNDSGYVDLPVIGFLKATDQTLSEFQRVLKKTAKPFFGEINAKVFLMNFYVKVLGEVNRPGAYLVYFESPTILDALSLAGDLTDFADRKEIKIVRLIDGKAHIYHVDVTDQLLLTSPEVYVQPGDYIFVKPLKSKKFAGRGIPIALSFLSTAAVIVSLVLR